MVRQILTLIVVLLVLDALWLTWNHSSNLTIFSRIQGSPMVIRWAPAAAVYVLIAAAVWFFAVRGITSVTEATGRGALLGISMYGVYDLTNYATLTRYPLSIALMDMVWGGLLCGVAAAAAVAVT